MRISGPGLTRHALIFALTIYAHGLPARSETAPPSISISPDVPSELNPPFVPNGSGGAPDATPAQAAAFAWQEFIALNWAATEQNGEPNERDTPSQTCTFGDPKCTGPLVWETFRGKVEIFPGAGSPPGYPGGNGDPSFGYDALPVYRYQAPVAACDPAQEQEPTPWVNLDETSEIALANMYSGVIANNSSPGNSAPNFIRFLAKANLYSVRLCGQKQFADRPGATVVVQRARRCRQRHQGLSCAVFDKPAGGQLEPGQPAVWHHRDKGGLASSHSIRDQLRPLPYAESALL